MKTAELSGAALALWVARAAGICLHDAPRTESSGNWGTDYTCTRCGKDAFGLPTLRSFAPHENWAQGGPIIEREKIDLMHVEYRAAMGGKPSEPWNASMQALSIDNPDWDSMSGTTALEAAMRAFVASKFGGEVSP